MDFVNLVIKNLSTIMGIGASLVAILTFARKSKQDKSVPIINSNGNRNKIKMSNEITQTINNNQKIYNIQYSSSSALNRRSYFYSIFTALFTCCIIILTSLSCYYNLLETILAVLRILSMALSLIIGLLMYSHVTYRNIFETAFSRFVFLLSPCIMSFFTFLSITFLPANSSTATASFYDSFRQGLLFLINNTIIIVPLVSFIFFQLLVLYFPLSTNATLNLKMKNTLSFFPLPLGFCFLVPLVVKIIPSLLALEQ